MAKMGVIAVRFSSCIVLSDPNYSKVYYEDGDVSMKKNITGES